MPTFRFKGLDEYILRLEKLTANTEPYMKEAIHSGAKIVADETKKAIASMQVDNSSYKNGVMKKSINEIQRQGLLHSFGVSPFQDKKGFLNVKTGFDGYNRIGQANVRVARRLERGTSWMERNPVISKASRRARKSCEEAMKQSFEKNIERLMK